VSHVPHDPIRQSGRSQLVDAVIILTLLFVTLFVTTFVMQYQEAQAESAATSVKTVPLDQLPINDAERTQYRKMIDADVTTLPAVNQAVAENQAGSDKYDINVAVLLGTVVLLAGYLGFVYRTSLREYREVIEEKYGPRHQGAKT
jgi:hypothetical protein